MDKQRLGKQGESLAARHLQSKGYRIIARNFRTRNGEIDLIATNRNTLVFIEVKTRIGNLYGEPLESITPWKIRALIRTANFFQSFHPELPQSQRIDAIAIELDSTSKLLKLEHIENITQ